MGKTRGEGRAEGEKGGRMIATPEASRARAKQRRDEEREWAEKSGPVTSRTVEPISVEDILLEKIQTELKQHHLQPGWMASPNHYGYKTWGVHCRDRAINPDTDCEFSQWGHATKDEAAAAWYRHVAKAVLAAVVSGNERT